jgi:glycosyltransferase involved in cell wall biosynthesis
MRILVISDVPWSSDNSVGNTYSNIFKNMQGVEFANLYCKSGKPDFKVAAKYYQMTEKQLLLDLVGKRSENRILINKDNASKIDTLNGKEQKLYDIVRTLRFQSFFLIRELIWKVGRWKTKELDRFLDEFKPDIIFSFCLDSVYYSDIVRYCKEYSKAKLVLFFADDVYAYRRKSPVYLTYQHYVRKNMRKLVSLSDLLYGATPQLCDEYSGVFKKNITPLYKICDDISQVKSVVNQPLIITYTGNLFYGRWKVLALVAQAIKEINKDRTKVKLNIYTTGLVDNKIKNSINIEGSSQLLGAITYEEVKKVLKNSDMVLHVESFDKKEIKKTRLSFSTKIVDCMQSGSCLLAIGPEETASIRLLKEFDIAQVVQSNEKECIKALLLKMLDDNSIIIDTSKKMSQFAINNHSLDSLEDKLYKKLAGLVKEGI